MVKIISLYTLNPFPDPSPKILGEGKLSLDSGLGLNSIIFLRRISVRILKDYTS